MKTLPIPSTVSPVKHARPASRQTLSAEWPGVASAVNGPTSSPSPGSVTGTPKRFGALRVIGCEWVSTTPSSVAAARPANRLQCACSAGPGSTTQPPTT